MPSVMEIVLLVSVAAGVALLWRQIEALRRERMNTAERIEAVEKRMNDIVARPSVVVPSTPDGEVQRLLAEVRAAQNEAHQGVETLRSELKEVRRDLRHAVDSGRAVPPEAEDVARRWLQAEGYACVVILKREERDGGERFLVSAAHGDQTRYGAILVRDLAVASANMTAPTFLFP